MYFLSKNKVVARKSPRVKLWRVAIAPRFVPKCPVPVHRGSSAFFSTHEQLILKGIQQRFRPSRKFPRQFKHTAMVGPFVQKFPRPHCRCNWNRRSTSCFVRKQRMRCCVRSRWCRWYRQFTVSALHPTTGPLGSLFWWGGCCMVKSRFKGRTNGQGRWIVVRGQVV